MGISKFTLIGPISFLALYPLAFAWRVILVISTYSVSPLNLLIHHLTILLSALFSISTF